MRRLLTPVLAATLAAIQLSASDYPIQPVPFTAVRLTGGFWQTRQEINRTVTVPFALRQCEESNRLANFDLAADTMRRRAAGDAHFQHKPLTIFPFDDSDAYKVIEGAAYVLSMKRDPALESRLDGWIARIGAAQEPDGYLYTFRTMHPDTPAHEWVGQARWEKDPELSHELYDAGHLYEAGVAYFQATGKRTLLAICLRNAELLWHDFGDGKRRLAPGHEIVEMGLVKLHRVTGDPRWLQLAKTFLDARGPNGPDYNQRHRLVVDQDTAIGHAVRANYLYSGMADVAALTGDPRYAAAIGRIWDNMAGRKLYLTGGVGALANGEAYGADYELPDDGYNETCAAVALMMWNHRMFLLSGDAKYMDILERAAYNGFISGVSESGDRFFYTNPLTYDGQAKVNAGCAGRAPWFGCACCPPNLMRTLAALTGYFYAVRPHEVFVNFYATSEGTVTVDGDEVKLVQTTGYPWQGQVHLAVDPATSARFTLRLRIPGWAQNQPVPTDLYSYVAPPAAAWQARVNGKAVPAHLENGYLAIEREWRPGDAVDLDLAMPVQRVRGNEKIVATRARVAFERGPVVFCFEQVDEKAPLGGMAVPAGGEVTPTFRPDLLDGVETLQVPAIDRGAGNRAVTAEAIPYFAWNNRGLSAMTVWLPEAK